MPALITLDGADVQKGRLSLGLHGAGWADLTVASDAPPSGQVRLVVDGGLEWVGTVRSAGAYLLTTEVRLVGGAGGLGLPVTGAFQGAELRDVLSEVMRLSGETQSASCPADVLSVPLERWTLGQCTAARALDEIAEAAALHLGTSIGWRVLADGTVWMGAESWPLQAMPDDSVISAYHPDEGRAVLGCAAPSLLPGVNLDGVGRVAGVDHYIDPDRLRTEVWTAEQLDPIAKLAAAVLDRLGLNYAGAPRIDRLLLARARVDAVAGDASTVDVTPESGRLSPMQKVPVRHGAARATVKVGAVVRLVWEGGLSGGVVALPLYDDGAGFSEINVVADLVVLGAVQGAQFVALANKVNNELNSIAAKLAGHKHAGVTVGTGLSGIWDQTYTAADVSASQVKAK